MSVLYLGLSTLTLQHAFKRFSSVSLCTLQMQLCYNCAFFSFTRQQMSKGILSIEYNYLHAVLSSINLQHYCRTSVCIPVKIQLSCIQEKTKISSLHPKADSKGQKGNSNHQNFRFLLLLLTIHATDMRYHGLIIQDV